jgi:hypothetical protein
MDPRIVLEELIKRLEDPALALGNVSVGQFSAWGGQEDALVKRWSGGRGFLAQALHHARRALATDDPVQINAAALIWPSSEREGMQRLATAKRVAGGKKRGEAVRQAAATAWEPYVKMFNALDCTAKARLTVVAQMKRDDFKLPNTGIFPDRRTIQTWLPIRKVEGS